MKKTQPPLRRRGSVFAALLVLTISLLVAGVLFLFNSLALRRVTEQRTRNWLLDVSDQVATLVDGRIAQSIESLNLIRDSAVLLEPEALPEFVERKAAVSGFEVLHLAENVEAAEAWIEARSTSLAGGDMVEPGTAQLILSRQPELGIYYAAGETADDPVMLGVKNADLLTSMLETQSFNGEGATRVITRDGELLAAENSGSMFRTLWSAWNGAEEERRQFDTMREDILAGRAGVATVETADEAVMVSYIPLSVNDWYVLTIIPADLLSKNVTPLVDGNLWLTGILVAIFGGVLITVSLLRRRHQASLEYIAFVDPLTGGMSETRFRAEAAQLLQKGGDYTFVSADLQGFKLINNIYGREEGNRTLLHVYNTLQKNLQSGELITHVHADLFYMLLKGRDKEETEHRLQSMYARVNAFNVRREDPYYLEMRFGACIVSPEDTDVAVLQERSSTARKRGGALHGGCTFYDPAWHRVQLEEKELVNRLDNSLRDGDFQVYYQPKVRLEDHRVCGAEALIRWRHPTKGMIPPGQFIPVLEKYRLVTRVDQFIFEQVCRDLARWKAQGRELCPISVNVSRQNLQIPDFLDRCRRLRDQYRVDRGLIEFELTETILLDDPKGVCHLIDQMHEAGFGCSMDDFGSGYSSLGLLNQLNVDTIKLDRSFFVGDNDSCRGRRVVESILKMAGKLHISTVAEGVEDPEQVQHLRHSACDTVQGYVFFRPLPVEEFEKAVWEDGRLRCVDAGSEPSGGQEKTAPKARQASSVVTFQYRPDTGGIRFSAAFSPVMEGATDFDDATALLRGSGLVNENDEEDMLELIDRCARGETPWVEGTFRVCAHGGGYEWMELHVHRQECTDGVVLQGVLVNTGAWRNELDRWKEQANRDGLTGLYNRSYFERSVQERLREARIAGGALVFIDVDNFKQANDALGHMAGDDILRSIARRILTVFGHADVVARYGGDEFVVFVSNISRETLENRLDRLCALFHNPYRSGGIRYQVTGSVGAALWPEGGSDYDTLLANADAALYEAKRRGKNQYRLYRAEGFGPQHP